MRELLASAAAPPLSWNLVDDLRELLAYPFMVNAFRAGTIVAVTAALCGWFMVLRRQTFAGHTLALVGFPGAAGAVLVGASATVGLFAFCVTAALVIALVPDRRGSSRGEETAVIGAVQTFALACGFLFVSRYHGNLNGITSLLFGNVLGITAPQVAVLAAVSLAALALLGAIARPLLFASIDPAVAAARGLPVRALSVGFLVLLGIAAAEAAQITGALLVFALLVLPAATAQAASTRPAHQVVVSVAVAVAVTWFGLAAAYFSPYPIGFWVTTAAFGTYLVVRLGARVRRLATGSGTGVAEAAA